MMSVNLSDPVVDNCYQTMDSNSDINKGKNQASIKDQRLESFDGWLAGLEQKRDSVRLRLEKLYIDETLQVATFKQQKKIVDMTASNFELAIKIAIEKKQQIAERKEAEGLKDELKIMKEELSEEKEERVNEVNSLKITVGKIVCRTLIERWARVLAEAFGDLMPTPKKKTPQERKAYWKDKAPSSAFFVLFQSIIDGSHPESNTFRPPLVAALEAHRSIAEGLGIVMPSSSLSFIDAVTSSMVETTPIYSSLSTDIHNTGRPVASENYLEPAMTLPACNGNPYLLWIGELVEGQVFGLND